MVHKKADVAWWDWLFSPPPMVVFLLLVDEFTSYLVGDPRLRLQVARYVGYIIYLIMVMWSISWWRRFGWKATLPGTLTGFWLAVMLVGFTVYIIILHLFEYLRG